MFEVIIGSAAAFVSVLTKIIGSPDQILKNFKLKSTKWLSTKFIVIWFVAHLLWTIHWILRDDMYLVVGQALWVITFGIIIYQIVIYWDN